MEFDKYERLHKAHYKELLRQAEQYRLVQQALAGRPRKSSLRIRLRCWLKQQLVNAGCIRQRIFGEQASPPMEPTSQYPCGERA
jgi:hypothetical protein